MKKQLEWLKTTVTAWTGRATGAIKALWTHARQLEGKQKKQLIAGVAVGAAVVVAAGGWALVSARAVPTADVLNAIAWDDTYLSDSSAALLLTDGRVSLGYLNKNLLATNGESFSISRVTDQVFSVRFSASPKLGSPILMQLRSPRGAGTARQFTLVPKPPLPERTVRVKLLHQGQLDKFGINGPILLQFSGAISAAELEAHLSFSGSDSVNIAVVDNVAVITPRQPLKYNTRYSLSITSGLSVNGIPMAEPFSTQFFTTPTPTYSAQDLKNVDYQETIAAPVEPLEVTTLFGRDSAWSFDPNGSLTLVFSDSISERALRDHLFFSPGVEYGLYLSGGTAIVTPDQPLEFGEEYTVVVQEGLESGDGLRLPSTVTFDLLTRPSSLALTFTSAERHVLNLTAPIELEFALESAPADHVLAELTLYRMNNYQQYRTILSVPKIEQNFELFQLDAKTEILRTGLNRIKFDNPGKGIYLVQAIVVDPETNLPVTFYQCFNVTELAVYLQIANDRTLAWVNNTTTAAAQSGLKVELSDRTTRTVLATGTTGADGTCELTYVTPVPKIVEERDDGVISIYNAAGDILYADVTATLQPGSTPPELPPKFFAFFFTDRLLYHPTDTISFWGYVKPYMLNTDPLPSTLRVYFDKGGLEDYVEVALSPDGVFTGEISIEQVKSAQYALSAHLYYPDKAPEEQLVLLEELWLEAKEFEKPMFQLSAQPTKLLFTAPEQVEVLAKLTFYDGTPVPNYPLELGVMNLSDGNMQEVRTVQTDESGTARFLFKPDAGIGTRVQNGPVTSNYTISLAQDGETVRTNGTYTYQPAGLVTDVNVALTSPSRLDLTLHTNALRRVPDAEAPRIIALANDYGYGYDYGYSPYSYSGREVNGVAEQNGLQKEFYRSLAGPASEVGVDGTIQVYYTDRQGFERELDVPLHAVTANGLHRQSIELEPESDPKRSVYAEVRVACVDDNLNAISSLWFYNSKPSQRSTSSYQPRRRSGAQSEGYSLTVTRNDEDTPLPIDVNYMGYNDQTVDLGDRLTFQLCRDGEPVANDGKLLYQLMQDQPLSQQVTTDASFEVSQTLDHSKSVHVVAAYFDGQVVHPLQETALRVDLESATLDIEITPDKESYRPGETARLAVRVKDPEGRPMQGNLCISVVDESIFALKDQTLDVVNDLYWRMSFPGIEFRKYTTTLGDIGQFTGGDGGKGGGGIESYDTLRKDFKDTALFYSTKTDAQGRAQVEFTLPDNTTSWRVTTVSVGGALLGGNEKKNIISTLPFFSRPVITPKYLAGDEVVMLAKSNGTQLSETSPVGYSVRIQGDGLDKTFTEEGTGFESARVSFGELEPGEYTVSTTAQHAGYRDTVVLPLTVIPSNLELVVNREVDPARLADLKISRYPVTLTFFDEEHAPFYQSVSSLLTHFCCRADQRLSRYVAKQALSRYLPAEQIPQHILDTGNFIADMQAEDGGIGWYPEDEISDPVLTTKVLMAVGNRFNTKRLVQYYKEQLAREPALGPVEQAAVHAGLALLGEPDATRNINRILESSSVAMQEKLYYLAGLAFGGDAEQALAIYQRDVAPHLKQAGDGIHLAYTNTRETDDRLTTTAWLVASKLGLPEADGIATYFSRNTWGIDQIFERMVYVANYNKPGRTIDPIGYTINGAAGRLEFGTAGQASMTCGKSDFEGLQVAPLPQGVSVLAYYIGEPDDTSMAVSKDIAISKRIVAQEDGSYLNTITVTLSKDAPVGSYDISDWIPSNMRFFSMVSADSAFHRQELQNMYFTLHHDTGAQKTYTITYQTRKTFDAKTVQDRTYIIHADSGAYNFAPRAALPAAPAPADA